MNKIKLYSVILGTLIICSIFIYNHQSEEKREETVESKYSEGAEENPAARLEYEFNMLKNPVTGKIPQGIRHKELMFAKRNMFKSSIMQKTLMNNWTSKGPNNVGGRTLALAVDVNNDNILLAGGVSSGVFRSTDQGETWINVTKNEELPNVTAIAQNLKPGHTNIWYYGTGEIFGNSASGENAEFSGDGIYKSTDNGLSWKVLPSTFSANSVKADSFDYCYRIVTNPFSENDDEVYAAMVGGIYRSTNGGTDWERVLGSWGNNESISKCTDLTLAEDGTFYATLSTNINSNDDGIYSSTDGINWTKISPSGFPAEYSRVLVAAAKSNPNKVYFFVDIPAASEDEPSTTQMWIYDAEAKVWRSQDIEHHVSTQGSYCMVLAVDPLDENIVYFGGVALFRNNDGFNSLDNITHIGGTSNFPPYFTYPEHWVDQHIITFLNKTPFTMISGNDAGVSITRDCRSDSVVWEYKPTGYVTSQFYTLAISPKEGNDALMGGLQDRGSWLFSGSTANNWVQIPYAGDGSYCAFTSNDSILYISIQEGDIERVAAKNDSHVITKIDPGKSPLFITPFELDPNDDNVMYLAKGDSLYRNSNLSEIPFENNDNFNLQNWSSIADFDQVISAIGVSKNPADIIYTGLADGRLYKVEYEDGFTSYSQISDINWNGYINCVAVNEVNADEVLTVFSNYEIPSLYYSNDGGISWTDVSGNLEENPDGSGNGPSCRWARIVDNGSEKVFMVGTSTGLYYTDSLNGHFTKWIQEDKTIGNSVVTMIKSRNSDGFVAAATHGKGVFTTNIVTGVKEKNINKIDYMLSQNYPNPFNPSTKINFMLPQHSDVALKIYDLTGKEVKTLINGAMEAGRHSINFDASSLASGVYFYKLSAESKIGKYEQTKKMILIK